MLSESISIVCKVKYGIQTTKNKLSSWDLQKCKSKICVKLMFDEVH